MTPIILAGQWNLTDKYGEHSCSITLPGDGISALFDAGLIPDPYWGRNEYDLRWISETSWEVTRTFELTETDVDLVLSEVDTVATVTVNGHVVANLDNAFRTWRIDLSDVARVGENDIMIVFHSPVAAGKAKQDAHPFEIPWSKNCPIPYGNFLRKPACDFGWDWNIALAPFGIYGTLAIQAQNATRIERIHVSQSHSEDRVEVAITAHIRGSASEATLFFADQELSTFVTDGVAEFSLVVKNPKLWWPAGQGDQPLYDLRLEAGDAVAQRRIGLRKMELITEQDDIGLGFKFRVNGRDVFCKGANWIPADALPNRITDEKTRDLLQSAVDANMNMVRVWGGGRYEPTSFYDTCDELGLMVWQDFMFACNLYPSDRDYLNNVRAEVRDNVARMQHHACIAVWCGDNELIGALTWYDVSLKDRDRYLVNYDRLNRALEDTLHEVDPNAIWWPSSPSPGPMNFGDAWHDDGSGDMHFWSVWHEGRDFDHYRDVGPRFCSEFGFQCYPSMNTVRTFTDKADRNIAAPVLESHQKNEGGNARIAETMFRYFRWPEKFDDFTYVSQIQQALAIKTAVTHWRSLAPRCMGTLIWQLNDTWPVCSWASLDYGGDWRMMHFAARRFFAPVLVTAVPNGDEILVRAVCDAPEGASVSVKISALALDGSTRELGVAKGQLDGNAVDLKSLDGSLFHSDEMLLLDWDGGREVFAPKPYKAYDLQPSGLTHHVSQSGDGFDITLSSDRLALFATVEADISGRWSDNALDLLPGEATTLHFSPADAGAKPTFVARDLHSATMT